MTQSTPFEQIGGEPTVRALVQQFYDIMETDPAAAALRSIHAPDLAPMRDRLGDFLCGWLGGPPLYNQRPDAKCMGSAHAPFAISSALRDQWVLCMERALAATPMPAEARDMMAPAFRRIAEALRNRD